MPEEEKEKMEEQPDASEETAKKAKSPIMKYGTYAGILIVIVLAAYFVTLKVVKPMFAGGEEPTTESVAQVEEESSHEEGGHGSPEGSNEKGHADGNIYLIEDIIVNPAGTGGRRFLSASVGFEMKSEVVSELMAQRDAVVRDALITIMSAQTVPQLNDFKQREYLRKIIKRRVEKLLSTDDIGAVYFTQFVLQ